MKKIWFKLSHTQFIFLFTLFTYTIYNVINIDKLTKWFYLKNDFSYFGFISYLILGYFLYVIVFTILAQKYFLKFFSLFIIIASTFISYFINKYNIALDTTMLLNALHTNVSESLPLFTFAMTPYVLLVLVLPTIVVLKTQIIYDSVIKHIFKSILIIAMSFIIALASIYISFEQIHRAGNLSNKYILYSLTPVNHLAATIDVIKKKLIIPFIGQSKEEDKIIPAKIKNNKDLVVVLAVGEAIRQKNLNLYGYTRNNTTPLLSKIKDLYALNGIARLGSTLWALPEILQKDDVKLVNITNSVDINTSCYVNYTLYENCPIGEIDALPNKNNKTYDENVIPMLEKNLQNYKSGNKFIVLHFGGGAHGPIYSYRYPKSFQKFKPFCNNPDMLNQCTKDEMFNAYDNAMLYQDYVINNTIETLENSKVPYVFIFVSDHGESLGEDGHVFHGAPPGMDLPYEQAHIALIVKSNLPIKIKEKKEYSQPDIFDTILDLFSIQTKEFDKAGSFIKLTNK